MSVKRQKFYWLFLFSELIRNSYSKIKKKINEAFTKYGLGILLILIMILLGYYFKNFKQINRTIFYILACQGTSQWLSAIGIVGATIIALLSIYHQKSHVGMDVSTNYEGSYVQIMNRTKSATFIKLVHIYMCKSNGFVIKPEIDFAKYYGTYMKWKPLKPYGCYTLKLVTKKHKKAFNKVKSAVMQTNSFFGNNPVSKLKLIFLINDHYYTLTEFVDLRNIMQDVHNH